MDFEGRHLAVSATLLQAQPGRLRPSHRVAGMLPAVARLLSYPRLLRRRSIPTVL